MAYTVLIDGRPAQGRPRGMGIYTIRLVRALLALNSEDVQIKVALDQNAGSDPWQDLIKLNRINGKASGPYKWEQSVLPKLAEKAKVDLLHCTANTSPRKCSLPYTTTVHDAIFMRGLLETTQGFSLRHLLGGLYYKWTVPQTARKAAHVITDSQASYADLISKCKLDPEKMSVIPLATPFPIQPHPERKLKEVLESLKLAKPFLVAYGALDQRKNTANLIRAFARLPRAAANTLVLLGFEHYEKSSIPGLIVHQGLKDRVRIMDYLPEEELTAVFQAAAAFVYPTRSEGFGLPLLQAFNLGVPVVTTTAGSIPEVAGKAARFCDPENPQSITHELLSILIDSNEAHRLALAGYMQAKKFTWEQTAQRTLDIYKKILIK